MMTMLTARSGLMPNADRVVLLVSLIARVEAWRDNALRLKALWISWDQEDGVANCLGLIEAYSDVIRTLKKELEDANK